MAHSETKMLKDLLKTYKITAAEFARQCNQSPQNITQWINKGIPLEHVFTAQDVINCTYSEIKLCQSSNIDLLNRAIQEVETKFYATKTADEIMKIINKMSFAEATEAKKKLTEM